MDKAWQAEAAKLGFGKVRKVLHTATLLHKNWETDNEGWIVEMEDGTVKALTTDLSDVCAWTRKEAEKKLAETEASAASIRKALELWPND